MVVVQQALQVGSLEGLVVLGDALEVVDGELRDPAVLLVLLEEGLEGIVAEERYLHQVFEALNGHGLTIIYRRLREFSYNPALDI